MKTKGGLCGKYRTSKTMYHKRAVAEFDAQVMRTKHPDAAFDVFRCGACGKWHIGRRG